MPDNLDTAISALDKVIKKSRVHLYKPIQIAEILYRDRIHGDIDISDLNTYRTASRKWRDVVSVRFLGRVSNSSARYQDDVFNDNAVPPRLLSILAETNRNTGGSVEAYIYKKFEEKHSQMAKALSYCQTATAESFVLSEFIDLFWNEPGLKRSIDKIFEIVVYALFSSIVDTLNISVKVEIDPEKTDLLTAFEDFATEILNLPKGTNSFSVVARFHRVGVTNAADRGLDMWSNFGIAVQIKHLSLSETIAQDIVGSVSADRIVIVCKDSEEAVIVSLLGQIGWKARIQSIITQSKLEEWYDRALKGDYSELLSPLLLSTLAEEIINEFPASEVGDFANFFNGRRYNQFTFEDDGG